MAITKLVDAKVKPFYYTDTEALYLGDSLKLLKKIQHGTIDMIFADPPYFLSNGGQTCHSGKAVLVDKGDWDKTESFEEKHRFNRKWIRLCKETLTESGTIWISGTYHNIYSIGVALEEEGFKILNNITWQKRNPPPNLACRCFTHSTETVIWACKKSKKEHHVFNYQLIKEINGGKQMKDVWEGNQTSQKERSEGKHPTQKPIYLLERIIEASTHEGDIVLDPFCGSSTTGVAAKALGRNYIGIDSNKEYLELSTRRLTKQQNI